MSIQQHFISFFITATDKYRQVSECDRYIKLLRLRDKTPEFQQFFAKKAVSLMSTKYLFCMDISVNNCSLC